MTIRECRALTRLGAVAVGLVVVAAPAALAALARQPGGEPQTCAGASEGTGDESCGASSPPPALGDDTTPDAPTAQDRDDAAGSAPPVGWELADGRVLLEADVTIAGVHDEAQRASMGRERQVNVVYAILALQSSVSPHVSFRVEANPAKNDRVPVPYTPRDDDRRTYFFPNQPEGRGAVSDPSGLYKVDYYKHPGLDPVIQQGALRLAYIDMHTADRRVGLRFGRFMLPRGLGLSRVTWFTAKDLTHTQAIDLVADSGGMVYFDSVAAQLAFATVNGNGNPYHDYGYFDFTDPTEDKNSAFAMVLAGRVRFPRGEFGASVQKNAINSRIEDATTFQLSKRNDGALTVFGSLRPHPLVHVFGQYSRYTWGIRASSAAILPGPPVQTPVIKDGAYLGIDVLSPSTRLGQWGAVG